MVYGEERGKRHKKKRGEMAKERSKAERRRKKMKDLLKERSEEKREGEKKEKNRR